MGNACGGFGRRRRVKLNNHYSNQDSRCDHNKDNNNLEVYCDNAIVHGDTKKVQQQQQQRFAVGSTAILTNKQNLITALSPSQQQQDQLRLSPLVSKSSGSLCTYSEEDDYNDEIKWWFPFCVLIWLTGL
jgi:hypothetical protein